MFAKGGTDLISFLLVRVYTNTFLSGPVSSSTTDPGEGPLPPKTGRKEDGGGADVYGPVCVHLCAYSARGGRRERFAEFSVQFLVHGRVSKGH